ncbi:hypothetical protein A2U01_0117453, partial [Trifolium medium]|nr:hypothetical protein [Trifolium medium]
IGIQDSHQGSGEHFKKLWALD